MVDEEDAEESFQELPREELMKAASLIQEILKHDNYLGSLRIDKLEKLNELFKHVADISSINIDNKVPVDEIMSPVMGYLENVVEDDNILKNSPELNDNIKLIKIVCEIVVKQKYKQMDPIQIVRNAMELGFNLDLDGCLHLDPITRNDIRRANCQIMKEAMKHVPKREFNTVEYFDTHLIKKQPSNLLFMLEYGLLLEKTELLDSYFKEILVGDSSIKEIIEDLAFNHSLDSSSSDDTQNNKNSAEGHLHNILKILQIILHYFLFKNDQAVEDYLIHGKDSRKTHFIFEEPGICYLLTKGIFELLDKENSATYFSNRKIERHINMIFHMMLSIESDHSLSNLSHLSPIKVIPKVKDFNIQIANDVLLLKTDIMDLVKIMISKEKDNLRKAKKEPSLESKKDMFSIIHRLDDLKKHVEMYERFMIVYDLNRAVLWMILTLLAHFDKTFVDTLLPQLLSFLDLTVRNSSKIRDLFYMNSNLILVQIILQIQPAMCLRLISDTCVNYLEHQGVLERILSPLSDHIIQCTHFINHHSEKILSSNSFRSETTIFFYQDVFEWMYCMQALIDILESLTIEARHPSPDSLLKTPNKTRSRLEIVLKNLLGPCIRNICDIFVAKPYRMKEVLEHIQKNSNYMPLQISKNLEALMALVPAYHNLSDERPINPRAQITEGDKMSEVIISELYSYLLRLFNRSILFSGTSGLCYQIPLLESIKLNQEDSFHDQLEYLRDYKFGYMFLTELTALYANFFLSEVEEYTVFDPLFTKSGNRNAQEMVLDATSNMILSVLDNQMEEEPDYFTVEDSLKNLYKSVGLDVAIDTKDLNQNIVNSKKEQKTNMFLPFIGKKIQVLERMVQRANLFQGDMTSEYMTRIYRSYMAKGLLKVIYKLVCSILYSATPEEYEKSRVFRVVQCLVDNFPVVERFIKPSSPLNLVDLKSFMKDAQKSSTQYTNLKDLINKGVSSSLFVLQASKLESIKMFIEDIYKDLNIEEFYIEIAEIARESSKEMEKDRCSELYTRIHLKENNNLRVMINRIKSFGTDTKEKEETGGTSIHQFIFGLKKDAISERGELIRCLLLGSEYSKDTYFENITGWICRQIEEASVKSELYPGSNMILFSDLYSMFHILDNLMLFSHTIRTEIHQQHDNALRESHSYNDGKQSRSVISYVLAAMIHKQKIINRSLFASNFPLELEFCFVFSFFLSSLTQNNYTPLKIIIGQLEVEGNKQAIPVIMSRLALTHLPDNYVKVDKIVMSDRADLVWYNVVCLNLLIECLSGPCTENQNLIGKMYKSTYPKMFMICDRIIGSIQNPFYHLQATIAKFLLTIFEGPNPDNIQRLNEIKPKFLYSIITNHLFNLWRYSKGPTKQKSPQKNQESNQISLNAKFSNSDREFEPEKQKLKESDQNEQDVQDQYMDVQDPDLNSLMHLYKTDIGFATNSSIVLARTIFLIMTYAESSNLRRYTTFLNEKRIESDIISHHASSKTAVSKPKEKNKEIKKWQLVAHKKDLKKELEQKNKVDPLLLLFVFLNNVTGTIEITTKNHEMKSNKQVRVVFPILPECLFFSPSKVDRFLETCTVDNHNSRLLELINFSDEILIEIEANIDLFKKSQLLSKLLTFEATEVAIWLSWIISVVMNGLWLAFAEITKNYATETIYERNDIVELVHPSMSLLVLVLNLIIVLICTFYFLGWLYNSYHVVLKVNKTQVQRQADREGRLKRMFLWTKHYLYDCLMLQGQPAILFLHILFVIFYYFVSAIFMTFHLLLFVYHFETTRFIVNSVTLHLSKILTALVFIAFVTYCASIIIGYHYGNAFLDEYYTKQLMDSWASGAVFVFDYGNQGGGGIGDYMTQLPSHHPYFFEKIVVTVVFFLLVKLIFTNIMLGIIVDTFMELRENQERHEDKAANECFICGLNRTDFEKRDKPFEFHVKREHRILAYLYYMIYLKKKNVNEFSGTELYVYNLLVKMKRTDWFPFQQTIFLGKNS